MAVTTPEIHMVAAATKSIGLRPYLSPIFPSTKAPIISPTKTNDVMDAASREVLVPTIKFDFETKKKV